MNRGSIAPSAYSNEITFASIYYKNRTGLLTDIRDVYADFTTGIDNKHILGTKLYSEQETSLFTKSKIEALYSYEVSLKGNLKWALGAQIGLANIQFKSTGANIGGSDWTGDISVSSTMKYNDWQFDIALNQLPNSELRPIVYTFILYRYIDAVLSNAFELGPYWTWESGFNFKTNASINLWSFDNKIHKENRYGILLRYGKENSLSVGGFLSIDNVIKGLSLSASYSNFFRQENLRYNSFSLGILYTPGGLI